MASKAIIVGASSGIGAELAKQLAETGMTVAVVARRRDRLEALAATKPDQFLPFVHDVGDIAAAPKLFAEITRQLGGLDLFIYAAGVMPEVASNEFSTSKDLAMIETNVAGAVAWLNLAAERFQSTHRGKIIAIGSVAGDRGRRGQPVYNASKAFLHTYMEALRNRLDRLGVVVVTIKPGPTATEMTAGLNLKGMMPVEVAAQRILQVSDSSGEKYLATKHRVIFAILRHIPSWMFRKLNL